MKIRIARPSLQWLASLALVLFLVGCKAQLQRGLSEKQANKIIVLLAKSGIQATKLADMSGREVKWIIEVDSSNMPRAIQILAKNNLPFHKRKGFNGVYGKTGMIPTATEEKAKYQMALSGELQNTLQRIDGVLDARVHLVIPKDRILKNPNDPKPRPRASVMVITRTNPTPPLTKKDVIGLLTGGSIEDIDPKDIKVLFIRQRDGAGADAGGATGDMANVLSVRVASSDAMKLKLILGLMSLLVAVFVGLFIWSFIRSASLKSQLRAVSQNNIPAA